MKNIDNMNCKSAFFGAQFYVKYSYIPKWKSLQIVRVGNFYGQPDREMWFYYMINSSSSFI